MPPAPCEIDRLGLVLLLAGPTAAPVVAVDLGFALLTAGDDSIEVGVPAVGGFALLLGLFAALFAVARRFLVRSRGRGTGMLLAGVGALCVAYLAYLAFVLVAAPVCDFGTGDACSYGTAYAPQPYAVVRVASMLPAGVVPVLVLVLLARPATFAWVTREHAFLRPPLTTRPFTVVLCAGAAAILTLATLHFPGAAIRLAGSRPDSLLQETTTQAYTHAIWLAALALVVAVASGWLATLATRGTRPAAVRALGGATAAAQALWLLVAIAEDPVRLPRFGLHDAPVPAWFHAAQGALALTVLLAAVGGLVALVLARPGRT